MMRFLDRLHDRWLTYRTGKTREERDWEAWYEVNVNYRAQDIKSTFEKFEYVFEVNPQTFFDPAEPFAWVPCPNAQQYFWPQRTLGENAVWRYERVTWDQWTERWHLDELGGTERVFVATNNSRDAVMMALKYT